MRNAMTWFSSKELVTDIRRASDYYYSKRGEYPDLVLVNPEVLADNPPTIPGVVVMPDPRVYRSQLWVGMVDQSQAV